MNIKTRITMTNMMTVLLAMVSLLSIGGLLISGSKDQFYDPNNVRLNKYAGAVETLLAGELSNMELTKELAGYNYRLCIISESGILFSNANPGQQRLIFMSDLSDWEQEQTEYLLMDGSTIVGVKKHGLTYIAVSNPPYHPWTLEGKTRFESFLWKFVLFDSVAMVVILLLNYLVSRQLVNRIMEPVSALADGARRVAEGDLSKPIAYRGNDEMVPVVTAFNEMQEKLLEEREKNAVYEKARTDLITGISHDLRTPLTSVKGYIKGLQDGVANTPEKQIRYLNIAYQKACEMDVLLHKLFEFSKLETKSLPISKKPGDLGAFLEHFVEEIQDELKQKDVTVSLECSPGTHPVHMDFSQFTRVLSNLTENALKYAGKRPLALSLLVRNEKDKVHLTFADNGVGVSEEKLPHLFEEFWRGDEARTRKRGEGSGLGLYIVKYIVEMHGGRVMARSENGLSLEIILPREEGMAHE